MINKSWKRKLFYFSVLLNIILILIIVFYLFSRKESLIQRYLFNFNRARIIMAGDSHIANGDWNKLLARSDVLKVAMGGHTSGQVRFLLENALEKVNAKICFIQAGGNDLRSDCYSRDMVIGNIEPMVLVLKARNIQPVVQSLFYRYDLPELNQEIDTLNMLLREMTERNQIKYLDINHQLKEAGHFAEIYYSDLLHLSNRGYKAWSDVINEFLADQDPK
ncbi:MAG: hypothetical protein JW731_08015 [Bacteroidales bacterium]|nr:hypothetical protein [Bacteroidales bacterium]